MVATDDSSNSNVPHSGFSALDVGEFRAKLHAWFQRAGRDLPWRKTSDPYAIWISEAMLQQTQVATVLTYYERWLARFPDLHSLAAAPENDVLRQWEGLGYYSRARNLHRAAQFIVERHGGRMPSSPEELGKLPGIGRYTAGAIAAFAFDLPVPVVDTNIARVLARLLNIREPLDHPSTQTALWEASARFAEPGQGRLHTSAIMELGALLCTPRKPECLLCPVKKLCRAEDPEALPTRRERPKITRLTEYRAVIRDKEGRIFLQISQGPRWKGMWLFPSLTESPGEADWVVEYSVTRYRMRLEASLLPWQSQEGEWFSQDQLRSLPLPAPHRRLLELVLAQ